MCSNMDGPRNYHTEVSQLKTNILLIYGIYKNDTNRNRKRLTDIGNKLKG